MANRLAIAEQMIAHYNAQDADSYVSLMTDDACEAGYRGAVVREGREGVREGLMKMFAEFPENRAEILKGYEVGATDFLTKPIIPQLLRYKVGAFVELFEKTRELERLRANLVQAREVQQRLVIRAPFSGTILDRPVDRGQDVI